MKIDFSAPLLDMKNEPILEEGKPFTLGDAAQAALLATFRDEAELDGKAKFDRYMVATTIALGGVQDMTVEDVALIKKLVGKAYSPLIVGRVYQLLEA